MEKNLNRQLIISLLIMSILLVAIWAAYFIINRNRELASPQPIAKVGEENIYDADLKNLQLKNNNPLSVNKDQMLEELIDDSIMLQLAQKEGWLTLDSSFYNNPSKNLATREQKISLVKEIFNVEKTSGLWVNILILNYWSGEQTDYMKASGIDAAASLAKGKMSALVDKIKQGSMTTDQAAQNLNSDTDLAQKLDPTYGKDKQYFLDHDSTPTVMSIAELRREPLNITSPSEINFNITETDSVVNFFNEGIEKSVSPIYKIQDEVDGKTVDGFYVCFQVKEKRIGSYEKNEFTKWIDFNKSDFIITKY